MRNMKWYQYCLFFLILWAPLIAEEELPQSAQMTFIADQKSAEKQQTLPSNQENSAETDRKNSTLENAQEQPDETNIKKATESYEAAFIKTIVVLVGLLALVILTVWMFKKISHGRLRSFNYMKSIKILEKRPLSPKSMLYLIEVGGKQILLVESQLHVKNVATLDWLTTDKDL